jgi:hypothetical protein
MSPGKRIVQKPASTANDGGAGLPGPAGEEEARDRRARRRAWKSPANRENRAPASYGPQASGATLLVESSESPKMGAGQG